MNKTLVAIAAAFLAVTTLCSAAEAGFKVRIGFGFPLGGFNAHHGGGYAHRHHRRHRYVVRRAKKKVHVAKAKTYAPKKVAKIAKVEPAVIATPEPVIKTETENSSITPVERDRAGCRDEHHGEDRRDDGRDGRRCGRPGDAGCG